ncbi:senataxin protein [Dioscorea alata]|uniref:Senataxin protein n=2 Tax=Dioscorea alata TaxID=55571 RepID=A0ACB7UAA3_DIOAL|nr:senataxin protein [Dioscorea alata]KAH7657207.1 senataxin protein [Dioscorea alata]
MGCRGRPIFDLNELPTEGEDANDDVVCVNPKKTIPSSNFNTTNLFPPSESSRIANNNAFKHASSVSGFQPFVRCKDQQDLKEDSKQKLDESKPSEARPSISGTHAEDNNAALNSASGALDAQGLEREEGEWSDMEAETDGTGNNSSDKQDEVDLGNGSKPEATEEKAPDPVKIPENDSHDSVFHGNSNGDSGNTTNDSKSSVVLVSDCSRNPESGFKGHVAADGTEEASLPVKPKDIKGVEASHALRVGSNLGRRPKLDEHKEAMLGKKRARQTMFINVEDAKQAGSIKTSTPRRQSSFPAPMITRTVKDTLRASPAAVERIAEHHNMSSGKDQKQSDTSNTEGGAAVDSGNHKVDSNGDYSSGSQAWSKKPNAGDFNMDVHSVSIPRQGSLKQPLDTRQSKSFPVLQRKPNVGGQSIVEHKAGNKKHLPAKKQTADNFQYQDTSVERLLREVTNEKFWHQAEETELQCVPGQFESVEEYVRVFEPLLFEECRAQLYSTWEEFTETVSRDAHIAVRVKTVERRERGWYDAIMFPVQECKWSFKEGDVAVISSPRPGSAIRSNKRNIHAGASEEDVETEVTGRVVGTVRRHIPTDTRDPLGAILHFYVGDSYDCSSKGADDHIVRKFQPKSIWYLTVLGSLATTQREYIALHAFRRLNSQMQSAILQPSPEHFPKCEEQPPSMPDCFTPNFVDYLHRTFNSPQLAAIQWAAMHTAAGTNNGSTKRQDPWPFTLVQGPPGTGKTHTVWGMLNVIHLVQYQHYYTALLKKLAPESYKQISESTSESIGSSGSVGSIDEVLQSMDKNLFRTLPKLCPKPRMLVCAPSNAATDELLARVLDRGFIDGEMKVYRPDVARVGVDSQTRAAQAVSVERRTEQLLQKGRDEVLGWMHQLKAREVQFSLQISSFQRELLATAVAGRSQGSVGVDPDVLVARDHNRDVLLQNLAAAVEGRDKVLVEMSRLCILESRFSPTNNFNLEDARAKLEASFANEAEVVFTTVSSSGRKLFSRLTHGFDMVVIDEAAQASEVAVLPPLSLGAARCVLVGDPQQLPATVISKAAGTLLYSRSLFERFQQAGCPTMLLSVQYRMHPQIRDFPSRYFYQGRLTDSESVMKLADEVYYKDPLLQPYVFFDISHGRESHKGGSVSYQNIHEAQFCLRLYEHLQKFQKLNSGKKVSVGIITPYKLQLKCLQREFEEVMNTEEGKDIYINTVDAFQGQERDVIIMSCVRASNHGVGFVADIRRMNVALTRARRALWVVGNANALMQSDDWAALIKDSKSRKCFMDIDKIPKEFFVAKGSSYPSGKVSSNNSRNLRAGQRQRHLDMLPEPRSGMRSEDDEKCNTFLPRNGSCRNLKSTDNSLDDFGQSGGRSREAMQNSNAKRQNTSGTFRREI